MDGWLGTGKPFGRLRTSLFSSVIVDALSPSVGFLVE